MSVIDLNLARVDREDDNKKVTVEELLRLVLKHVSDGQFKNAKRAIVCIVDEGEGESPDWVLEGYRCGLERHEEIGVLDTFKAMRIRDWFVS